MAALQPNEKKQIKDFLTNHFNLSELRNLAFDLGVDHEILTYQNKIDFSLELFRFFEHRGTLGCLIMEMNRQRPNELLVHLLKKLPSCSPTKKIQIEISSHINLEDNLADFVETLARELKLDENDIAVNGLAQENNGARLLVSLPEEIANSARLSNIRAIGNDKYKLASIAPFETLDEISQRTWQYTATIYQSIRRGRITINWLEAFRAHKIPKHIDRYEVKELIGMGGMANVYRAYDPRSGRDIAVKVIRNSRAHDPEFQQLFQQEIRNITTLEHSAIVPVYDMGQHEGSPFLVMRLMSKDSLRQKLDREGRFSPIVANDILNRLVEALKAAHECQIIHRDIKPANILLNGKGEVFLSDFGIARIIKQTGDQGSAIVGTPEYMAPEQWNGEQLDERTDVYQLGILLFELLTGQVPYQAKDRATFMDKHLQAKIPSVRVIVPELPAAVDLVLQRALAKNPEERYPSPNVLASAFTRAIGEEKIANRYKVKEERSHGPVSSVYLVDDPQTGEEFALRIMQSILRKGFAYNRRLNRVSNKVLGLRHKTIVSVYDLGLHEDKPYLTMDRMYGSLHAQLQDNVPLPLDSIFLIANRIATALDVAHQQGITHGDVKPGNVLYDREGQPCLSGFGLVTIAEQTETDDIDLRSFSYMAPEQWQNKELKPQTDIYQFGVMLFELLTGRRPFEDEDLDRLRRKHLYDSIPSAKKLNPTLPPEYDDILAKAMEKDAEARFPTAGEFATALTKAERKFTLESFYQAGREYYHADKWQEAINAFEEVVKLQLDYKDVQDYIERAQTHRRKTESLQMGQKALDEYRWEDARNILKPLGEYRGANVKAAEAERQINLEARYREGLDQYQKKNLIKAKNIFDEIDQLDPGYKDVDDLRQEIELKIDKIFRQGFSAFENEQWQTAIDWFEQIKGHEDADRLYQQAEKEIELENLYEIGFEAFEQEDWPVAKDYLERVETIKTNYKDVQKLLAVAREKRHWRNRLNLDRIGLILGLLGIIFAIAFDFFGFGYNSLRQLPLFQGATPTVEPTPSLEILEDCLASAVPVLTVANGESFNANEPIPLNSETAEFELSLQSETCSKLQERTFISWHNEEMTVIRDTSTGYLALYNAPCNQCVDEIYIETSVPNSTVSKTFEFTLNIDH